MARTYGGATPLNVRTTARTYAGRGGTATPISAGTTGGGTTITEEWRPSGRMPKYKISEARIKKLARERLSTYLRPARRGLRETLTQAQTGATGPIRARMMEMALRGFSGSLGGAVQSAREYGRTVAGRKAELDFQAAMQGWLKQGTRTTTKPESGTSTQPTPQITATPQIRRPGPLARLPYTGMGWRPGPGGSRYAQPAFAKGGPVTKGGPYIVGEEGPEIFMPKQGGTIIPNPKTQERMGKTHQFDFRQFLSRQYGGPVRPEIPGKPEAYGMAQPLFPSPTEEMASPTEILPTQEPRRETTRIAAPTVAPPATSPTGVRAPGFADLYRDLLKRKRKQTSLRTLI